MLAHLIDVPNLDDLTTDASDLRELSSLYSALACVADWKARAIELRTDGDIEAAQSFEAGCQCIYRRLPEWARW